MTGVPVAPEKRFWPKVDLSGGPNACWQWLGATSARRDESGQRYGNFSMGGSNVGAHRAAYVLTHGPIPAGLHLDHLCRNRICVNPAHLEPVTAAENNLRGTGIAPTNAKKTECVNGHRYDTTNTYIRPDGKGRDCRACRRAQGQKRFSKRSTTP